MDETEPVPYSFLRTDDYYCMTEGGKIYKVIDRELAGTMTVQAKGEEPKTGKPDPEKIVHVLTVYNGKPLPAAKRAQERLSSLLGPLGAEQVCMSTMTPGEVAMHLELFHGIYARNCASVSMPPRERGKSLRDTHAADHAAIQEHGLKPPQQVPHTHDDRAFKEKEARWMRGSQQKTR